MSNTTVPCPLSTSCPEGGRHYPGTKILADHVRLATTRPTGSPKAKHRIPTGDTVTANVPGFGKFQVNKENERYFTNGVKQGLIPADHIDGIEFAESVADELAEQGHNRSIAKTAASAAAMDRDVALLKDLFGSEYDSLGAAYVEGNNPAEWPDDLARDVWEKYDMRVDDVYKMDDTIRPGTITVSALVNGSRREQRLDFAAPSTTVRQEGVMALAKALESHYLSTMEHPSSADWGREALTDGDTLEFDSQSEGDEFESLTPSRQNAYIEDGFESCYEQAKERFSSFFSDRDALIEARAR